MRITAGKHGGRVLTENKFEHIRPTADMVKQALFNKLGSRVYGAKVLDLCCGTGALGIEAVSRGAREVVFVDNDARSISLTQKNLNLIRESCQTIKADAVQACKMLANAGFDIILFDPPYKAELYISVLNAIAQNNVLAPGGILAVEHAKADKFDWPAPFEVLGHRQYGIKQITYLTLEN